MHFEASDTVSALWETNSRAGDFEAERKVHAEEDGGGGGADREKGGHGDEDNVTAGVHLKQTKISER